MLREFIEETLTCAIADIFTEIQHDFGIESGDENIDHAIVRDGLVSELAENIIGSIRYQMEQSQQ